jgi:predicted site-specific integrase-resolvase
MTYTVKQLADMSGVSVRTLHFYDETGLLKPAFHGTNGYRVLRRATAIDAAANPVLPGTGVRAQADKNGP